MTTKEEPEFNFNLLWKVMQIASPLVSVVALIVYMNVSLTVVTRDVLELQGFNKNIGSILTAHTTQLAINQQNIAYNEKRYADLSRTIESVGGKIDSLREEIKRNYPPAWLIKQVEENTRKVNNIEK